MISRLDEWQVDLKVKTGFSVYVFDSQTLEICGTFDKDQIAYEVSNKLSPEEVYCNGELDTWALAHGYRKDV